MSRTRGEDASDEAGEPSGAIRDAVVRNEKMLHARIPESLDREIKRRAGRLGMSVSTIVRHVLLNTFNLVEDIVADSTRVAFSIVGEETDTSGSRIRQRSATRSTDDPVIGWQEALLNLNAVCDHCNVILAIGTRAAIGIREQSGPPKVICKKCLAKHLKRAAAASASGV